MGGQGTCCVSSYDFAPAFVGSVPCRVDVDRELDFSPEIALFETCRKVDQLVAFDPQGVGDYPVVERCVVLAVESEPPRCPYARQRAERAERERPGGACPQLRCGGCVWKPRTPGRVPRRAACVGRRCRAPLRRRRFGREYSRTGSGLCRVRAEVRLRIHCGRGRSLRTARRRGNGRRRSFLPGKRCNVPPERPSFLSSCAA